jgi:hypothetical protein
MVPLSLYNVNAVGRSHASHDARQREQHAAIYIRSSASSRRRNVHCRMARRAQAGNSSMTCYLFMSSLHQARLPHAS